VGPSVDAGPDTTSDWGKDVQFNGQASDPGSADQATLNYTWSFGDGSPSASGGPSVAHSYATPGDHVATRSAVSAIVFDGPEVATSTARRSRARK